MSSSGGPRQHAECEPDGAWLTFAAAAERFGIGADAVRMRAKRLGWRTMPGIDGRTLVWVEGTAPERPPEREEQSPEHAAPLLSKAVAALETAVILLGDQLAGAEARAGTERERAEAERERATRAEQASATERRRADGLRDRLNTMQEQLSDAHAALQASASADARADRAEADRAEERGRADRAEAATAAERARADALRERIEVLQRRLTARQEVVDAAEATRKAEDARRARGRWARLRAAWQGE